MGSGFRRSFTEPPRLHTPESLDVPSEGAAPPPAAQPQPQLQRQPSRQSKQPRQARVCFEFADKGRCSKGDSCTFPHVQGAGRDAAARPPMLRQDSVQGTAATAEISIEQGAVEHVVTEDNDVFPVASPSALPQGGRGRGGRGRGRGGRSRVLVTGGEARMDGWWRGGEPREEVPGQAERESAGWHGHPRGYFGVPRGGQRRASAPEPRPGGFG
jgi:hypothetical protein